jgi:hypothetical protein
LNLNWISISFSGERSRTPGFKHETSRRRSKVRIKVRINVYEENARGGFMGEKRREQEVAALR